ncbi:MAG: hypothetical protein JWP38_879 [Herbaspirillum sp.]|jgi:hypothetical protein|nr:hypothetical protein [Herbaspirillum sp.]
MFDKNIHTATDAATAAATAAAVDIHRNAYNAAFYELGLKWYWDCANYQAVLCPEDERQQLRAYLETQHPHMLKAYDTNFLIDAIQTTKARCYSAMAADGRGLGVTVNWAEIQQHQVGV